jgi:hypothetical protein
MLKFVLLKINNTIAIEEKNSPKEIGIFLR